MAIRRELGLSTDIVNWNQMQKITGLDLVNYPEVESVVDLKHCLNLSILSLQNTRVTDISPLSELSKLETLSINSTPVSVLDALKGMENLRRLFAGKLKINDISALSSLTGLRYLSLAYSSVTDIGPLIDLCLNGGLKKGEVNLWETPLSRYARMVQVPALISFDVEVIT